MLCYHSCECSKLVSVKDVLRAGLLRDGPEIIAGVPHRASKWFSVKRHGQSGDKIAKRSSRSVCQVTEFISLASNCYESRHRKHVHHPEEQQKKHTSAGRSGPEKGNIEGGIWQRLEDQDAALLSLPGSKGVFSPKVQVDVSETDHSISCDAQAIRVLATDVLLSQSSALRLARDGDRPRPQLHPGLVNWPDMTS